MKFKLEIQDEKGKLKNIKDYLSGYDNELVFDNIFDSYRTAIKISNELFKIDKKLTVVQKYKLPIHKTKDYDNFY